jgi:hypothetical protein
LVAKKTRSLVSYQDFRPLAAKSVDTDKISLLFLSILAVAIRLITRDTFGGTFLKPGAFSVNDKLKHIEQ